MKRTLFIVPLVFLSFTSHAKTVADFINGWPELATSPTIRAAIQQGAIGNAGLDAMSNGATSTTLGDEAQKLLAENGYDYAQAALRDLATTGCGENGLAEVYGLREKDCQAIIKVDAQIE
ncbi:hypothetical protein GA0061071_103304 [Kosakonia oryzendophytica]|uniref:Uncharacterized protein n=1 Tax=Kosakonia oryzendophytica TaxID=1005665 RepID=A0A1C4AT32_9ENTR|nr:hypothetical protein [Kosakonia oryzendophytica]AMO50371.1 Hypothetical protein AKI40_3994 [Enterobacter sp. FY-07]TDT60794.1 hypothetical protein DFO53_2431 [Enterobacter sp. AG5470]WBT57340.1 hypothetical protein O9K67_19680 [Kosakonia oryzendophytica]SCB97714.1 hypothetical protein GA0061071_103304 [Kosakonia oryzendophytica]